MSDLVLGISAYYHDSAAALVSDGVPIAAAQQERFSRRRHDAAFPADAVRYCLDEAGVDLGEISSIAYYEDPKVKFHRVLTTFVATTPTNFSRFRDVLPEWLTWKRSIGRTVRRELEQLDRGPVPPVICGRHHASHAASAFLPSPFDSAAVLCVDSVGEWDTTTLWHADGTNLRQLASIQFPHSLGLLYSAFTYFCGFKVDSGEYKLMGLAPYGDPRFANQIRDKLIDVKPDGSFRLNTGYFDYLRGEVMTGKAFEELFEGARRLPETPLTEREFDLAASVQQVTEEIVLAMARKAQLVTGERSLCLAGGVALNCVANGKISEAGIFDQIWVQPAAGDAGGALGAALAVSADRGARRPQAGTGRDAMNGALLGPAYSNDAIATHLEKNAIPYQRCEGRELFNRVADALADGAVVGWFQDRMEFGPRALGARSILGDPRYPAMQSTMNLKIKFRESFRPFAPSVLDEEAPAYFDLRQSSPYMLVVADVAEAQRTNPMDERGATGFARLGVQRSTIPAVTHVDTSARVQTVSEEDNPWYYKLLGAFKEKTGCPVLVNTSFNVRGEPIVRTPEEAYACFMRTDMDMLVLGSFVLDKRDQPEWSESADWRVAMPLD